MQVIKLWDNAPGLIEDCFEPVLEYYPAEVKKGKGAVVILPGGGYSHRAVHEGEGYAKFLNSIGLDAFVCEYRVKPYTYPYPLLDARRAMRYVRNNAEKFGIDPSKIAIMGSSAGGHLAATTSVYSEKLDGEGYDELDLVDYTPNAQILCYPVTDFESHNGSYKNLYGDNWEDDGFEDFKAKLNPIDRVRANLPPAFIWHTEVDKSVSVVSTLKYVTALHEADVRVELHVYPEGWHGLGLATDIPFIARWANDLEVWLKHIEFIDN